MADIATLKLALYVTLESQTTEYHAFQQQQVVAMQDFLNQQRQAIAVAVGEMKAAGASSADIPLAAALIATTVSDAVLDVLEP